MLRTMIIIPPWISLWRCLLPALTEIHKWFIMSSGYRIASLLPCGRERRQIRVLCAMPCSINVAVWLLQSQWRRNSKIVDAFSLRWCVKAGQGEPTFLSAFRTFPRTLKEYFLVFGNRQCHSFRFSLPWDTNLIVMNFICVYLHFIRRRALRCTREVSVQ